MAIAASVDLEALPHALRSVAGVRDAVVVASERVAHLKVMPGWDEASVMRLVEGRA
ncbi:MAG: hypothetical protein WCA12_21740 [Burkholderiales bacterium]